MTEPDLIRELRLRRWAREHYVPAGERALGWDPIAQEEMQRRDAEPAEHALLMAELADLLPTADVTAAPTVSSDVAAATVWDGGPFVPLFPGLLYADDAHSGPAAPNFLNLPARTSASESVPIWGLYTG